MSHILDLSDIPLVGREEQLKQLDDTYRRVERQVNDVSYRRFQKTDQKPEESSDRQQHECILVAGKKGCGKTKLVMSFRDTVIYSGGCWSEGRFKQSASGRPFHAIVEAIETLFNGRNMILEDDMITEIRDRLGDDIETLYSLVPNLMTVLDVQSINHSDHVPTSNFTFARLKQQTDATTLVPSHLGPIFLKLFQAITKFSPLVLFLDDLQWMDDISIELLNHIMSGENINNFLFVGAHRDDETLTSQKLARIIPAGQRIIQISDLSQTDLNILIARVLRLEISETMPLAAEVYRRTSGNCFFALRYLQLLADKRMLYYSMSAYEWCWELERIRTETFAEDNVVEFVMKNILNLSTDSRLVLAVAACFGNKFSREILSVVIEKLCIEASLNENFSSKTLPFDTCRSSDINVHQILEDAVKKCYIDDLVGIDGSDQQVYKFSHETIQVGAYNLSEDRQEALHLAIGKILWFQLLPEVADAKVDSMLVQIVDQFDRAQSLVMQEDKSFRLQVAKLHVQAARAVKRESAFLSAAEYLRTSVSLLGERKWYDQHALTLSIFNLQAEVTFCRGKYSECTAIVDEILANTFFADERLDAYLVLGDCLGAQKKTYELLTTVYPVVAQLGYATPKTTAGIRHILPLLLKIKRKLKQMSDEEFLSLENNDDPAVDGCAKLMSRTNSAAWIGNFINDVAFISCFSFNLVLTKGLTKFSASALLGMAVLLSKIGDLKNARRLASIALILSDKFKAPECDGQVLFLYNIFFNHHSNPMHHLLDPLIQANKLAKAGGDIEHAHSACGIYIITFIVCGLPLSVIDTDAKAFIDEMKQYKHSAALTHSRLYRQAALNLICRSPDPLQLEGEEISDLNALLKEDNQGSNERTVEGVLTCKLLLACFLGEGTEGKDIALKHAKLKDSEYPICYSTVLPFYRALVFFRVARKGGSSFFHKARRESRRVKTFVSRGFVNCTHLFLILQAEEISFSKKAHDFVVKAAYDKAISHASRSGFPQDAALVSENCGRYFRNRNDEWSSFGYERAVEYYRQWGAKAKIEILEEAGCIEAFSSDSVGDDGAASTACSTLRGRPRRNSFYRQKDHEKTDWSKINPADHQSEPRSNLTSMAGKAPGSIVSAGSRSRSSHSLSSSLHSRSRNSTGSSGSASNGYRRKPGLLHTTGNGLDNLSGPRRRSNTDRLRFR